MTPPIRTQASTSLAKALAYHDCGKPELAMEHAIKLVELLKAMDILPSTTRMGIDELHRPC